MENSSSFKGENRDDFSLKLQYSYISSTPQIIVENDQTFHNKCERNSVRVCRLCANIVDKPTYLFTNNENGFNLAEKINSCLPITVKKNDMLPKQLCSNCIEKLHECFQFYGTCISAEKKLIAENTYSSNVGSDNNNIENKLCNDSYNCPLCVEGTLQIVDTMVNNEIGNTSHSIDDVVCTRSNISTHIITNTTNYFSQGDANFSIANQITHKNKFISDLHVPTDEKCQETFKDLRNNNFVCRICDKIFHLIEMIHNHCKTHSSDNFFPCVLCYNIHFNNESQLDTHFYYNHQMLNCYNGKEIKQNVDSNNELIISSHEIENKIILTDINFPLQLNEDSTSFKSNTTSEILEGGTFFYNGFWIPENKEMCGICGLQFSSDAMLLMHVNSAHVTDNMLEIADNSKLSESSISLKQHEQNEHTLGKPFQCEFCDATFSQLNQVKNHIKQFHEENIPIEMQICYQCGECKSIFPDVRQVSEHSSFHEHCTISSHYIRNVFKCEYCDLCFLDREDLKKHLSQHIGELPYECLQCNLHFESYYKISEHKKMHENNSVIQNSDQFSIPVYYICEFCGRNFEQWQSLYIHRYKSHLHGRTPTNEENSQNPNLNSAPIQESGQSHLCEVCGKIFESQSALTKHRRQEHPQTSKYRCPECGKVLANLTGLIIHRRLHTGEKPFVCDVCGKSFHQSSGMYTHRRTHTRECPYRCEYCGQAYNVKGDLDNHRRAKHTKERPFKCETCQKSFLTSSVFYQHRILHTGVRKYKCMYCEKSFARWNALRLHIRTHTGEKPYICYVCQRGFAQKGDMKKHMKTQHNIHEVPEST